MEENRRRNLALEVERATASLQAAQLCLQAGLWDDAVSRSYYAAYHMVQAVLFTAGLEARTHEGLHDLFFLHFVRPGIASRRLARLLASLQKYREQADYSRAIRFDEDGAGEALAQAQEIHEALRAWLTRDGWLG
jgi:uncharacterized protein (UPF0332 family)